MNLQPTLANELLLLRPLQEEDFEALYQVAKNPLIWEQHWAYDRYKKDVFTSFFKDAMKSEATLIVIHKTNQEVIGSSRFKMVEGTETAVEIGWSFLAREYWGGIYNKSMKSLMINYALEYLEEVVFYVAKENMRSQKAVGKIGGIKISEAEYPYLIQKSQTHFAYRIHKDQWISTTD